MNNLFKLENSATRIARLFGIIALVAIIGFSFAACNMDGDDDGNNNNQQTQAPDITFTLSDGTAGDNKFEMTVSGAEWDIAETDTIFLTFYLDIGLGSTDAVYTLSADKKTAVITVYDRYADGLPQDTAFTFKFHDNADSKNLVSDKLLDRTSVHYSSKPEFWDEFNTQTYQGTVSLVEPPNGVTITVRNDEFKPE